MVCFFLAVTGAYILGNAEIISQWIGWSICSVSCLIWIFMGLKDRDLPRTLDGTYVLYNRY